MRTSYSRIVKDGKIFRLMTTYPHETAIQEFSVLDKAKSAEKIADRIASQAWRKHRFLSGGIPEEHWKSSGKVIITGRWSPHPGKMGNPASCSFSLPSK